MKTPKKHIAFSVVLVSFLAVAAFSQIITSGSVQDRAAKNLDKMRFAYRAFLNITNEVAPSTFLPGKVVYLQTFGSDYEIRPGDHVTFTSFIESTDGRAQAMINKVMLVQSIQHDVRKLGEPNTAGQVAVMLICKPVDWQISMKNSL